MVSQRLLIYLSKKLRQDSSAFIELLASSPLAGYFYVSWL